MDVNYDLEKLEKKTASLIFQDGIFDMSLGLVLIAFGIATLLYDKLGDPWDSLFGFLLYLVIAIPLFMVQIFVTRRRLGEVKFSTKRKKKNMTIIAFATVLLLSNIVVFILIFADVIQFSGHAYFMAAIFGLIPLILFTLMAYFLDYKRLYIVGSLFSLGFFLKEIFTIQNLILLGNIIFIGLGVVIVTIGVVYLIRFLKKYPKVMVKDYEYEEIRSQQ
ncbi:MAG: hypothetical protein FK730_10330 [Asgard group archaeon]|nr:hypothetical protein [Asgard group archaeon]